MAPRPESKRGPGTRDRERTAPVADAPLAPGLFLVSTPIGNAADITLRALDVLARADVLLAEDTRETLKLMGLHGIDRAGREMLSYHDRNAEGRRPRIVALLAEGQSVAYCSDAGTPLISDPGYRLVALAQEAGHAVTALPGASAILPALQLSGLPTDRFLFAGFLPPKSGARRRALAELAPVPASLVIYESPRRLAACLADMAEMLGDRPAAVTRELTKRFEEVRQGRLSELAKRAEREGPPKGEIVIVVGPPEAGLRGGTDDDELGDKLAAALERLSVKDAAAAIAAETGLPRREVYARALAIERPGSDPSPDTADGPGEGDISQD